MPHDLQYRKSGEPVITHSIATAEILAGIGADSTAVAAGLLHDVLDDTLMSEQQLRDIFGGDIADLVSKVSIVHFPSALLFLCRNPQDLPHLLSCPRARAALSY